MLALRRFDALHVDHVGLLVESVIHLHNILFRHTLAIRGPNHKRLKTHEFSDALSLRKKELLD